MTLFQRGDFQLASGASSNFKIECDTLTDEDWATLAMLLAERVPPFRAVYGVPRGGIALSRHLDAYRQRDAKWTLVVDDVWTTGGSFNRFIADHAEGLIIGAVVFARGPVPGHVTALFQMPEVG